MAERRRGAYIWTTWLAKAMSGASCPYRFWFSSNFKYAKHEEMATDLVRWNREHTALMQRRRRELEEDGWTCSVEEANAFRLEGKAGVVAGKPDLVAVKDGQCLVVDGKTGKERDSDLEQVLIYLWALPKSRPDLPKQLEGEVLYKSGSSITVTSTEVTPEWTAKLVSTIQMLAAKEPPAKEPSRDTCRFCNVGQQDCPQRVTEKQVTTMVGDF